MGKLIYDPALYDQTKETMTSANSMLRDVRAGKGSLGKFVADDTLYDNLAGLTGDMRLLIGDFRQNPKKFLHIKITLF